MRHRIFFTSLILAIIVGGVYSAQTLAERAERKRVIADAEKVVMPEPKKEPLQLEEEEASSSSSAKPPKPLKAEVNWDVPFTSQAPTGNWNPLFEEACEEASVLMVLRYFQDRLIHSPAEAERDIEELVKINEDMGFGVSDTVQQVAALLAKQGRNLRISVKSNPTEESLKRALSDGNLVIIPAAGRNLGNPYYQRPGPLYHMLVLRGYTADGHVITNDPGTKHGEEYPYTWETLIAAIHDWNDGNVEQGEKAAIIVGQYKIIKGQVGTK